MLPWKTIDISDNERALLFRRNRFERILDPGRHKIWVTAGNVRIEKYDITDVTFDNAQAKFLLATHTKAFEGYVETFEMADDEIGLFYRDGHLVDILKPGTFLPVWKGIESYKVERVNINQDYRLEDEHLGLLARGHALSRNPQVTSAIYYCVIADEHVGLLSVNGKLEQILPPGSYGYWKYNRSISVKQLDLRLQGIEVSGQEILTKDRVSLRINLSGSYKIVNPNIVATKLNDYVSFIYRELQLRLREAVGTQTLDTLLEDKNSLNGLIETGIQEKAAEYGIHVASIGVKDIILPGDMKQILNQVVEAQKESEANLIKRREETQAMRSLHNTAKMMENNPTLLRLKELEALERVTARINNISVYGGLDAVLTDLVKLRPSKAS